MPVEKAGDSSPLLEQAMQVGDFAAATGDTAVLERPEKKQQVAEPRVGSYEAFMSSFGSPARWAGR